MAALRGGVRWLQGFSAAEGQTESKPQEPGLSPAHLAGLRNTKVQGPPGAESQGNSSITQEGWKPKASHRES